VYGTGGSKIWFTEKNVHERNIGLLLWIHQRRLIDSFFLILRCHRLQALYSLFRCWYFLLLLGLPKFICSWGLHTIAPLSRRFAGSRWRKLVDSSEAASCAATQELPSILWNPKVHYRVHQSPALVPILSQFGQVHKTPSYLSKIHLILPTNIRLGLPSGLLSSGFPTNILHAFLFSPFVLHILPISIRSKNDSLAYRWNYKQVWSISDGRKHEKKWQSCHSSQRNRKDKKKEDGLPKWENATYSALPTLTAAAGIIIHKEYGLMDCTVMC
jgi:hypothetical protein